MAINLVDLLSKAVTPDLAASLGNAVGASDSSVASAIGAFLPMLVGGMATKAATPDGASGLFSLLTGSNVDSDIASTISGQLGSGQTSALSQLGSTLLGSLFGGDKVGGLTDALGQVSGLGGASAKNLAFMLAPMAFGVLKKYITGNNLNAGGVAALLRDQSAFLGKPDPRLAGAIGVPAAVSAGLNHGAAAAGTAVAAGSSGLMKFLPWLIGGAAAIFLVSQLGMCSTKEKVVAATAPVVTPAPAPAPAPAAVVAPAPAPAPVAAIGMPAKVYFETGKSAVSASSAESLGAAVAWLKADAARKVAITGHTDKSGNPAGNEQLAKARAARVRDALMTAGVAKERIEMKAPLTVDVGATMTAAEARRVDISAL